MKGNCVECERRYFCEIDPDECDEWTDPAPQTNADRIRAMSDEELAHFMAKRSVNEYTVNLLDKDAVLTAVQIEALKHNIYCSLMQWLKQPAEVNDNA